MDTIVPFGVSSVSNLKTTHHHYCGFYSLHLLAGIVNDLVVVNGKEYQVSEETVIDWAYDGVDTIVAEKRLVYSDVPWKLHDPIFNTDGDVVGLVGSPLLAYNGDYCYAVQDAFKYYNNHLSNVNLVVKEKTAAIAYADRQFETKKELKEYLENETDRSKGYGAILYHTGKKNAQLILYRDGVQLSNSHLRKNVFYSRSKFQI